MDPGSALATFDAAPEASLVKRATHGTVNTYLNFQGQTEDARRAPDHRPSRADGEDMLRSTGQETRIGNNTTVCLDVDSREEADRVYGALSEGGPEGSLMADMPRGAYWGPSSSTATAFAGSLIHTLAS